MTSSPGPVRKWSVRLLDWLIWRPIAWCSKQTYRLTRWMFSPRVWLRFFGWLRLSSISLRRWLIIALIALVIIPGFAAGFTGLIITLFHGVGPTATEAMVSNNWEQWSDPAWQARLTAQAEANDADVVLYHNGEQVFRTDGATLPFSGEDGGFLVTVPTRNADYVAAIRYRDDPHADRYLPVPISYLVTLILTFIGIALFFGRSVVKPLAATSAAAGDVAGGNLDISLPCSRVREVRELNAAFEGMAVELKESLEHESKLQEERKQFISAIVHDLRTPLFALRGSFEAIETGVADTPEKQKYYFQLARERADALDRMITDLFEFTRLEYLDQDPAREPLDFGALVERVAETLQPRAADQQARFARYPPRALRNLGRRPHADPRNRQPDRQRDPLFRTKQHDLGRSAVRAGFGRSFGDRTMDRGFRRPTS
ncbi:MAG: HAMP domain-containing histidine kinase [Thermomicrobiales bacterium]|nr:HAMP domain-containing histidine kinase [Thermomicrobiales bacterium]